MIEIERKKLDLMQSMGKEQEDRDMTYHFLMSLRDPINKLPENRQMFLHMKIQEMIFQETEEHKRLQSCTNSCQVQAFGELNQTDKNGQSSVQSFFYTFT
jgi:hypothetical protein